MNRKSLGCRNILMLVILSSIIIQSISLSIVTGLEETNDSTMQPTVQETEELSQDIERVRIDNLEISSRSEYEITGNFDIINELDTYIPELFYTTELYLKRGDSSNLINIQSQSFSLLKDETKQVNFTHATPFQLPKGEYFIIVRIKNKVFTALAFKYEDLGNIGSVSRFLEADIDTLFFIKNDENIEVQTGPSYAPGEKPLISVTMKNPHSDKLKVKPLIRIYKRSIITNPYPVYENYGQTFEFESMTNKNIKFELPSFDEPSSYQVLISFVDESGSVVSGTLPARYVITGPSATILKIGAYEENGALYVNYQYIGPADATELNNAMVKLYVSNADTQKTLFTYEKSTKIGPNTSVNEFKIPVYPDIKNINIVVKITYNDKVLALSSQKYEISKVMENTPKILTDVKGTIFEDSVNFLTALGISQGYPDETFRPETNITRSELITLWLKLLGYEKKAMLNNTKSKFIDVKENNWDTGFVNVGYEIGFIKGYPDNKFIPTNPITYSEVMTILVKSIEGDTKINKNLPWPENYVTRAKELNLFQNIQFERSTFAIRGNIAIILKNTFEKIMLGK